MTTPKQRSDATFDFAIGRVVRAAASLEATLRWLHAELMQSPFSVALTDGLTVDTTLQGINRLADLSYQNPTVLSLPMYEITLEMKQRIRAMTDRIGKLMEQRHEVVHGSWGMTWEAPDVRVTRLRRRKTETVSTWTLDSLRILSNDFVAADAALWELMVDLDSTRSLRTELRADEPPRR